MENIFKKIGNKAKWISRQIRKFESYQRALTFRKIEYVSGESFFYLGRKYRLKVIEGAKEGIKLYGKYLRVFIHNKKDLKVIEGLVLNWYLRHAKDIFNVRFQRLNYILLREEIAVNHLRIRRMGKRWGNCTDKGNIVLNLSLIQAPVKCIDYVLIHEICHLKYLAHSAPFYKLLEKYMEN